MTIGSSSIANMGGIKQQQDETNSILGPFWKNHHPEPQSTSSSATSSSKSHKRSDSRATVATATSSLSADTELSDKQRSNLSDSIEEEDSVSQQHGTQQQQQLDEEEVGDNTRHPQHLTPNAVDPEQPGALGVPSTNNDEDGGIFQQMFDGMSNLIAATTAAAGMEVPLVGETLAAVGVVGGGETTTTSYRSQPPILSEGNSRNLHEEEKKDGEEKEEKEVRKSAEPSAKMEDIRQKLALQEEEARARFDRLRNLIMLGDLPDDDDEDDDKDDISPPNPQPLHDDEPPKKKQVLLEEKEKKEKQQQDGGAKRWDHACDRRTKKMLICALVAMVLLCALVVPVYLSLDANQKASAALATATLNPTDMPSTRPSTSLRPSPSPTMSRMPSARPTDHPTAKPTMSDMPTETPSLRPTATNAPSQTPSVSQIPSVSPSHAPTASKEPSEVPSYIPSQVPSTSIMPSYSTISPDYAFKVRLQWQQSYFWQEEKVERWWCLECVKCTSYGGGDGNQHGCRSYGTGNEAVCEAGDSIWIRDCRERANRFNVLENRESGFMLRVATTNLCITRERRRWLKVEDCDRSRLDQQFVPWEDYNKFELRPLAYQGWGEREADCVSQLHHPKQDELVSLHNCRLCRIYETRYWQVYLGEDD